MPMTTPSLPARFGHRAAPSVVILMRVRGASPGCSSGDRDEPRITAGLIYSPGDEKRSVPNAWRQRRLGFDNFDMHGGHLSKLRVNCSLIA